jgi:hypothetical protein
MRTFLLICTAAVAITMAATTKSDAMSINAGAGIKPAIDVVTDVRIFSQFIPQLKALQ